MWQSNKGEQLESMTATVGIKTGSSAKSSNDSGYDWRASSTGSSLSTIGRETIHNTSGRIENIPIKLNYTTIPVRRGAPNIDTAEMTKRFLLEEMVARVIKIKIKAKLRVI